MMVAISFIGGFFVALYFKQRDLRRSDAILEQSQTLRDEARRTYEATIAALQADKAVLLETRNYAQRAEALLIASDAPVSERRH